MRDFREAVEKGRKEITKENLNDFALKMSKRYNVLSDKFFEDTITKDEDEEMNILQKVWTVVICGDFGKTWNIGKFEVMVEKGQI